MVLDSSVIIKWFRQEEILAREALALRQAYLDGKIKIVVPTLLAWEIANVLRFKHELSADDVRQAVTTLFAMGFEWVAPDPPLMDHTVGLAFAHETTIYDACFAALAEVRDTRFVTADDRLVDKLAGWPHVRRLGAVGKEPEQ